MMDLDIKGLVPRFILKDRNGFAMAKAIEAGLNNYLAICQQALGVWGDVDAMPEWRLDELAWEYNIPYDHTAAVEKRREWVRNAYELSRLWGTAEGIRRYLDGYFDNADIEEYWKYGGDPYHFRLALSGEWSDENHAWTMNAANMVKNLRSVLDALEYRTEWPYEPMYGAALYSKERATYTVPAGETDYDILADGDGTMLTDEDGIVLVE